MRDPCASIYDEKEGKKPCCEGMVDWERREGRGREERKREWRERRKRD